MFTPNSIAAVTASLLLASCVTPRPPAQPSERYGIGRIATAEEIRGWDIDVRPDGSGLPAGSGRAADGRKIYEANCVACHGANGAGGVAPRLTGGVGSLTSKSPVYTIGSYWPYAPTVFDYVRRSMPWDKPMSLTSNEVYAVTAYLLHADGIIPVDAVMDAKSLPQVRMPNREGFVNPGQLHDMRVPRCMENCGK